MASVTWTDVTGVAAALSATTASHRAAILAYVNGTGVAVDSLDGEAGETTKLARTYLAAHMGTMNQRGINGSSGTVTAQREGEISVHYASPDGINGSKMLSETPYGRLFQMLISRNHNSRGPRVI